MDGTSLEEFQLSLRRTEIFKGIAQLSFIYRDLTQGHSMFGGRGDTP